MTSDAGLPGVPRFDVVLRGYDRRQVDEHVERLQRVFARMRADLDAARHGAAPIGPVPRPAPAVGAGLPEGDDQIGHFTDRMHAILQEAEQEAAEIRRNAHRAARAETDGVRAQLADLVRQRDSVLAELTRMRGQLEGMLAAPTASMPARFGPGQHPRPDQRPIDPRQGFGPPQRPASPGPVPGDPSLRGDPDQYSDQIRPGGRTTPGPTGSAGTSPAGRPTSPGTPASGPVPPVTGRPGDEKSGQAPERKPSEAGRSEKDAAGPVGTSATEHAARAGRPDVEAGPGAVRAAASGSTTGERPTPADRVAAEPGAPDAQRSGNGGRSAVNGPAGNGPTAQGVPGSGGPHGSTGNGPAASGPAASGPAASGPAANGPAANGPTANGPTANGPTANGPTANGPTANGPTANGPTANGPTANGRSGEGRSGEPRRPASGPDGAASSSARPDGVRPASLPLPSSDQRPGGARPAVGGGAAHDDPDRLDAAAAGSTPAADRPGHGPEVRRGADRPDADRTGRPVAARPGPAGRPQGAAANAPGGAAAPPAGTGHRSDGIRPADSSGPEPARGPDRPSGPDQPRPSAPKQPPADPAEARPDSKEPAPASHSASAPPREPGKPAHRLPTGAYPAVGDRSSTQRPETGPSDGAADLFRPDARTPDPRTTAVPQQPGPASDRSRDGKPAGQGPVQPADPTVLAPVPGRPAPPSGRS